MKYGSKKITQKSFEDSIVESVLKSPDLTTNRAGGVAFKISEPAAKLITMVGGQFFNEPSYYASNEKDEETGLNELANDVINTAKAVAHSENPRDLLAIANWLRNEKNIRTTAAVLYAVAAGEQTCQKWVKEYGPKVLKRADDVRQAFAAYFGLYAKIDAKTTKRARGDFQRMTRITKLPNSFKKGIAEALSKFDEYQLSKWDSTGEFPTFKDVILTVDRKADYPVKRELASFWLDGGKIVDAEKTPILAARKALAECKVFDDKAKALAIKSHATQEVLTSQFGNNRAVWETLIEGGYETLPVMAAARNLANMEEAGISDFHWDKVSALILGHKDNKMMPFRFVSARQMVNSTAAKSIAEALLDQACDNVAELDGKTVLACDYSASMDTPVSVKTKMTKMMAGTALMAVLAKKLGKRAVLMAWGTNLDRVQFSTRDSAWRIVEDIKRVGATVGHSTHTHLIFEDLIAKNEFVDRVIVMSDMQCYGRSYGLEGAYQKYRKLVNPNCRLISIDIGGHGTSGVQSDPLVLLSTGFNESIIKEVVAFEKSMVYNEKTGAKAMPSDASNTAMLDYVRLNF